MRGYIRAAIVMAACTVGGTVLMTWLSLTDIAMLHLIGVGVVAARATRRQAAFAALLSVALFDFFFVPPRFAFTVFDLHYVVTFAVMLVTALVISWLAQRVREEAVATEARDRGTAALSPLSAELLGADTTQDVMAVIGRQGRAAFEAEARVLLREPGGRLAPVGARPRTPTWTAMSPSRRSSRGRRRVWARRTSRRPEAPICRWSARMGDSESSSCGRTIPLAWASPPCGG